MRLLEQYNVQRMFIDIKESIVLSTLNIYHYTLGPFTCYSIKGLILYLGRAIFTFMQFKQIRE